MRVLKNRDLRDIGDETFEDFVAALLMAGDDRIDHLQAPEGGADMILEIPSEFPKIWQVKHHPDRVRWDQCVESLDAAVSNYTPREVVFVFPRNLTLQMKETFKRRLVDPHRDIAVNYMSGAKVIALARTHPDIVEEFFGLDPKELRGTLAKEVVSELESRGTQGVPGRFQERVAVAAHAARRDRLFRTSIQSNIGQTPVAEWAEEPFLIVSAEALDGSVTVAAWPEEGVEIPAPLIIFEESDEGDEARRFVRDKFAHGETAEVGAGVRLRIGPLPEAIKAAFPEGFGEHRHGELRSTRSHTIDVEVREGDETYARQFQVFAMPPESPDLPGTTTVAFGGFSDGIGLFLNLQLKDPPTVSVTFQFVTKYSGDRASDINSARFTLALMEGEVTLRGEPLLPRGDHKMDGGNLSATHDAERTRFELQFFEALAAIESATGEELDESQAGDGDIDTAFEAQRILAEGKGTMKVSQLTLSLPSEEYQSVLDKLDETMDARVPFTLPMFGRSVVLGTAEVKLPPPELVVPMESSEQGNRDVELRWPSGPSVPFKLVREQAAENA